MKSISVDIESFSSANLAKSGMYRYAEAEDFEILLFGYSVDGGQVRVVDLARGERIPKEILQALTDRRVVKWAFNAAFERICLSRYLGLPTGTYLDPSSWRCTMIWSAYMGLPLSLLGVGTVLKLEKRKLAAGKDLIRYFCTPSAPTIANGKRTRNRPSHAPERWKLFVEYNKRDVEVELAIHQRLRRFPVPDAVWDEYHLDQRINDRGVLIDRELVRSAIKLDSLSRHELVSRMKEITDLENPNSVSQVKTWLSENGLEVDSLGKKDVIAALPDAPREIREVLELRLQLAKSSVKKYQAMENAACSDDRARGMFQFYGANRTGRWCLTGDHEVLTIHGWERLDSWKGGLIASWSPVNEGVVFSHAKALCFDYEGPMYEYRSNRIAQVSTPDHKMYFKRQRGGAWSVGTVEQMATGPACIPFTGYRMVKGRPDNDALRVLVMTQADGHYAEDGSVCYNFTKQRKIERCKTLLRRAGMVYTLSIYDQADRKYHRFRIANRDVPLWLRQFRSKTFGTWLFDESADIFFDELPHWDGYRPAPNSIQYTTCNKVNADLVQAFAHLSGRVASLKPKKIDESRGNCQPSYNVSVWLTPGNCHEISKKPTITDFKGKVFCAQTQSGYFLVRREGRVWVTGNSGRLIQMQNLRRNSIEDLAVARTLVKRGDYEAVKMLYGDVPDTLSQLVRTAFIPRKGYRFIVADFSAIEARVLSWLAGETWRMEIFAENGDIYCATASRMFHCEVTKHGENGHLRQKGKQAELACIAEGQLVLTDQGLVPIEQVTTDQLLWDGEAWVSHEGVINKGRGEVITYGGLTATADHLVWIEGEPEPVHLGIAATCGSHLVQTGDGGNAIRLGADNIGREAMECEDEPLLCAYPMCGMPEYPMAGPFEFDPRQIQRMPAVLPAESDTNVARPEINSSETAMRESEGRWVSQLRGTGHTFCFFQREGGGVVPYWRIWATGQGDGDRPYRQRQGLRGGQFAVYNPQGKQPQQAQYCPQRIQTGVLAICKNGCYSQAFIRSEQDGHHRRCHESCCTKKKKLEDNQRTVGLYDIRNAGSHHRFTVSGVLVHNCGYGGSVGALKAMGALESGMTEDELKPLVDAWRQSNPNIVQFWWDVDKAALDAVRKGISTEMHNLTFSHEGNGLFITLPSTRKLAYVRPKIETNDFGSDCITYEGTGSTKKWERIGTYGPKLVENCTQAISRDLLCHAMRQLETAGCRIVMHIHDEVVIEAPVGMDVQDICRRMSRVPPWAKGLLLNADGYETDFYKKD